MQKVTDFIELIRDSFIGADLVFTRGSCYKFYLILKQVFPQSVPWYSEDHDHIVTCIDGILYDITGAVTVDESFTELKDFDERIQSTVKGYKFNGHIDEIQCPYCDNAFKVLL